MRSSASIGMALSAAIVRKRGRGVTGCSAIQMIIIPKPRMTNLAIFFLSAFSFLASDFAPALPGYEFQFPRDHGSHDEYRTEWWYYTGHLRTDNGHRYGFEVTFFRVGVVPPDGVSGTRWDLRNL